MSISTLGRGTDLAAPSAAPRAVGRALPTERIVLGVVLTAALFLVAYPVFFLVQVSLNVGKADARPIVDYGLANFSGVFGRLDWLGNSLLVSIPGSLLA